MATDLSQAPPGHVPADAAEDLIYRLSHDLSAPARAIRELSVWISEDTAEARAELPGETGEHLAMLRTYAERLDRMVSDLLSYSRIGKRRRLEVVDLAAAVAEVAREHPALSVEWQACGQAARLDSGDLRLALTALLGNAAKHGAARAVCRLDVAGPGEPAILQIGDDGPGIPPGQRGEAIKVMTTLRSRDEVEGSGMGLAICERLAASYCGAMTLDTAPQGGLLVRLILPQTGLD